MPSACQIAAAAAAPVRQELVLVVAVQLFRSINCATMLLVGSLFCSAETALFNERVCTLCMPLCWLQHW
jgi:hypothetical protein